jgi:hypothetical protein
MLHNGYAMERKEGKEGWTGTAKEKWVKQPHQQAPTQHRADTQTGLAGMALAGAAGCSMLRHPAHSRRGGWYSSKGPRDLRRPMPAPLLAASPGAPALLPLAASLDVSVTCGRAGSMHC